MCSQISKESQDSNQLSWICLKWFVWFLSKAPDNFPFYCFDPRAQLIVSASCSGHFCHSLTSPVSKWHRGDTLSCPDGELSSRCPSGQLPLALTDKHWRCDPTPSLLWAWATITALPPLWPQRHPPPSSLLLLALTKPSPSQLPHPSELVSDFPHHQRNHLLSCMSTTFVCGGKYVRNVLWLHRSWKHRCFFAIWQTLRWLYT